MLIMMIQSLSNSLNVCVTNLLSIYDNNLYTNNLIDFLKFDIEKQDGLTNCLEYLQANCLIEVCNVSFSYPDQLVKALDNVNFSINRRR